MSDVVLAGLISATASIIIQLIVSAMRSKEYSKEVAMHEQKQQDTLDDLNRQMEGVRKRLDAHNGYAEKFASASKDIALIQKDLEYIKKGIK